MPLVALAEHHPKACVTAEGIGTLPQADTGCRMLYRLTVQGEVDHQAVAALDPVSIEPVNGATQIEFDLPDDTDMEAFAERLNRAGLTAADIVTVQRSETDADVADAAKSRKRAIIELLVVAGILIFIFVILLPQFIDYGQVIDSMRTLTLAQILLLFVLGMARIWFEAGVYNVLIPGLAWWPGFKAWAASNSVAFIAPPGADLAIRYGMYRSVGVGGESAGAGIILSWFFTTGIKLIIPVLALVLIVIDGVNDDTTVTVTIVAVAALIAGVLLVFMILYRESVAFRLGSVTERWYNRILAGRWKFSELSGLGEQMISFRSQIVEGLSARWLPATLVTLLSQTIFFVMLVMSMRFVGVTSEQAGWEIIFDAYAVGLLLSLIPILPAGLGVVEVAYVGIIAGESGTDLANAVMAGAFVHRIFTWFVPILVGFIPLAGWRKQMKEDAAEAESG
jgi:uncharacterized protein (TIRG00374 family)